MSEWAEPIIKRIEAERDEAEGRCIALEDALSRAQEKDEHHNHLATEYFKNWQETWGELAAVEKAALKVHRTFDAFYRCVMEFGADAPAACGEYLDALCQAEEQLSIATGTTASTTPPAGAEGPANKTAGGATKADE